MRQKDNEKCSDKIICNRICVMTLRLDRTRHNEIRVSKFEINQDKAILNEKIGDRMR